MKKSEFRELIREEAKKQLNEYALDASHRRLNESIKHYVKEYQSAFGDEFLHEGIAQSLKRFVPADQVKKIKEYL